MANITKIPELNKGNPLFAKAEHAPAKEAPVTKNSAVAARYKDPRIDLQVFQRKDGTRWLRVALYSHMKPNNLLEAPVECQGKSQSDLDFEIGVLCGAMAERLSVLHSDPFDPERCAREGSRKFAELVREMERT